MYLALYRRFRPETFDKVLGQEHIVRILSNQIRLGTVGHAYLFCGTRGTGKTSMARLLAKGVNCLAESGRPCGTCKHCVAIKEGVFMDVIEIDAASNNGVDNIRELRESVRYSPAEGRRKAYIIDEAHMLTAGAFNALLKTLEEPPEHVMFVLATTEPQKLPATILSRCLRLDFRRVPADIIKNGMESICEELGARVEKDALTLLAANADGSVRDGLSLLDQCLAAGETVTRETVLELLGSPGEERLTELTDLVWRRDVAGALSFLAKLLAEGKDEKQLMKDWIEHFRNLILIQHFVKPEDVLNLSVENIEKLKAQSAGLSRAFIRECIFSLAKALNDARWSGQPRILLEVAVIDLAAPKETPVPEGFIARPLAEDGGGRKEKKQGRKQKAAEIKEPGEGRSVEGGGDIDWDGIIAEATEKRKMLARMKGRSGLAAVHADKLEVDVYDGLTLRMAQESKELLEQSVLERYGRRLSVELRLEERSPEGRVLASKPPNEPVPAGNSDADAVSADALARRLEMAFNMKVEVKEPAG
ncbi:MAG: DNA polymerase III subunit gamma/tau [Clostridiales Family XIII bacterium]|jgi:DNA polymerase-3 subunit gamma/tau|nr:DNA polymerase III subunit gamma/tau [Clostridiales Family XIII bacterium]